MWSYVSLSITLLCFSSAWAGGFLANQAIPYATVHLNTGATVISGRQGEISSGRDKARKFELKGPYFEVTIDDAPVYLRQITTGQRATAASESENRALTVWQTLHAAVINMQNILGREVFRKVNFPISVMVDFDEGCNAGWDGSKLLFHKGDKNCQASVYIKDIVVHELGHALLDHLKPAGARLETDYNEGMADLLAASLSGDPIIGENFFKGYSPNYLRTLERPFAHPHDWRGTYSGALILSTFGFAVYQLLKENFPPAQSLKMFLQAYFALPERLSYLSGPSLQNAPGALSDLILSSAAVETRPGLQLWLHELLARHGFEKSGTPFQRSFIEEGIRFSFPAQNTPGELILTSSQAKQLSFPIAARENSLLVPYSIFAEASACGRALQVSATLYQDGAQRTFGTFKLLTGKQVRLVSSTLPLGEDLTIPDLGQGVLKIPYTVTLVKNELLIESIFESHVEHFFPDDLRLSIQAGARVAPIERGVEERALPNFFELTQFISQNLRGTIVIRDIGRDFTGKAQQNTLHIKTLRATCP